MQPPCEGFQVVPIMPGLTFDSDFCRLSAGTSPTDKTSQGRNIGVARLSGISRFPSRPSTHGRTAEEVGHAETDFDHVKREAVGDQSSYSDDHSARTSGAGSACFLHNQPSECDPESSSTCDLVSDRGFTRLRLESFFDRWTLTMGGGPPTSISLEFSAYEAEWQFAGNTIRRLPFLAAEPQSSAIRSGPSGDWLGARPVGSPCAFRHPHGRCGWNDARGSSPDVHQSCARAWRSRTHKHFHGPDVARSRLCVATSMFKKNLSDAVRADVRKASLRPAGPFQGFLFRLTQANAVRIGCVCLSETESRKKRRNGKAKVD